jgi:hypothetical protein
MEIVEGVKEGEKVVAVGQQNLSEGAKVSVQQATPASSESGARSSEKEKTAETKEGKIGK